MDAGDECLALLPPPEPVGADFTERPERVPRVVRLTPDRLRDGLPAPHLLQPHWRNRANAVVLGDSLATHPVPKALLVAAADLLAVDGVLSIDVGPDDRLWPVRAISRAAEAVGLDVVVVRAVGDIRRYFLRLRRAHWPLPAGSTTDLYLAAAADARAANPTLPEPVVTPRLKPTHYVPRTWAANRKPVY